MWPRRPYAHPFDLAPTEERRHGLRQPQMTPPETQASATHPRDQSSRGLPYGLCGSPSARLGRWPAPCSYRYARHYPERAGPLGRRLC